MNIPALLALLAFIVPMCFTPGPNNVLCAAHGSRHGVRKTVPLIGGMAIGWSVLGVGIAAGAVFIEEHESITQILSYLGATYIVFLAYKITFVLTPIDDVCSSDGLLGVRTGLLLQFLNGKLIIYYVILMATFESVSGEGYEGKIITVLATVVFGLAAVLSWATFGTVLRRIFSGEESGIWLNRMLGLLLFLVAVWIAFPHTVFGL